MPIAEENERELRTDDANLCLLTVGTRSTHSCPGCGDSRELHLLGEATACSALWETQEIQGKHVALCY